MKGRVFRGSNSHGTGSDLRFVTLSRKKQNLLLFTPPNSNLYVSGHSGHPARRVAIL